MVSMEMPKTNQQIAPTAIRRPDSRHTPMENATKPIPDRVMEGLVMADLALTAFIHERVRPKD